jgi:hypothetical protein
VSEPMRILRVVSLVALAALLSACTDADSPVVMDVGADRAVMDDARVEASVELPRTDIRDVADAAKADESSIETLDHFELPDVEPELIAFCGDGICYGESGEENCSSCPDDCGTCPVCGNGICEAGNPEEGWLLCPEDCGWCGDGTCSLNELPEETFCNKDCGIACGDGICAKGEGTTAGLPGFCPVDCGGCYDGVCGYRDLFDPTLVDCKDADCGATCGDGACENTENSTTCPFDCPACGDDVCAWQDGTPEDCPEDCTAPCGDGLCTAGETAEGCPQDCGPCGDGVCSWKEAAQASCWSDCDADCGDGTCQMWEDESKCPVDCACKPACQPEWQCGQDDNGCGEPCGGCPAGIECLDHVCCVPACKGAKCGDDGCGGSCGQCPETESCVDGQCLCVPLCAGNVCGADGCGGSCGVCLDELMCTSDICHLGECKFELLTGFCLLSADFGDGEVVVCVPGGAQHTDNPCQACLPEESTTEWSPVADETICGIGQKCYGGVCCSPALACADKECGDFGCGTCGTCIAPAECVEGLCLVADCEPVCDAIECGDDGCGGSCGKCNDGISCTDDECAKGLCSYTPQPGNCVVDWWAEALCVVADSTAPGNVCQSCQPTINQVGFSPLPDGTLCGPAKVCLQGACCDFWADCLDKECGQSSCGGSCGECGLGYQCMDHLCECEDSCAGKQCGTNACGESCGFCAPDYDCLGGICICQADCEDKACGDDGCGGSCGICDDLLWCTQDTCANDPVVAGRRICTNEFMPAFEGPCMIDGVCYEAGETQPGFPCRECDSVMAWAQYQQSGNDIFFLTWAQYGCVINGQCYNAGAKNPDDDCERCDIESNLFGWSDGYNGTICQDTGLCLAGVCCQPGPNCAGLQCGDDGCGGTCGSCLPGLCSTASGKCSAACDDGNGIDWDGCTDGQESEVQVNQVTADAQSFPSVATFPDGVTVVVWQSREANGVTFRISGRLFGIDGLPLTDEFQVNDYTLGGQMRPSVAAFADGRFVVAWDGSGLGGTGIFARVFAKPVGAPGTPPQPLSDDLPAAVLPGQSVGASVVTMGEDRFAVVFANSPSYVPAEVDWDVYAALAWAPGGVWAFVGAPFRVHESTDGDQSGASAAGFGADGFVVAWQSCPGNWGLDIDSDGCAILGRGFDALGSPLQAPDGVPSEILLNQEGAYNQTDVDVAAHAFDKYIAVWANKVPDYSGIHVTGRPITGFDTPGAADFFGNDPATAGHWRPVVTTRPAGSIVIAWESWSTSASTDYEVLVRLLAGDGTATTQAFAANLHTSGRQGYPDVAAYVDGSFVVTWVSWQGQNEAESASQDGDAEGVYMRRFKDDGTPCPAGSCTLPEAP